MTPQTYHRDVRTILKAFLEKYFDGNNHDVGGVQVNFPQANVRFERQQMNGAEPKPLIIIDEFEGTTKSRKANKTGIHKTNRQPIRFLVLTFRNDKRWDDNDLIVDLLEVLMNGAPAELGLQGLRPIDVRPSTRVNLDASQENQCTQRVVSFRVDLDFKAVVV